LIDLPGETLANLTRVLEAHEHTVVPASEPADAIFCSPGQVTPEGVRRMAADHDDAPVIVVTGEAETGKVLDAMDHGAANYCSEPIEESEVLFTLASALCALERPV
jgi:DNA-binding NarL/FixJ family response regulator